MAISVNVPKDLSKIKKKVVANLTKRQLICFSMGALVGVPFYFFSKDTLGSNIAAVLMVAAMLPFFFIGMDEKKGGLSMPTEKKLYYMIRQKFIVPGIRRYKTENLLSKLEYQNNLRKELIELEQKEKGYRTQKDKYGKAKQKR